MAEQAKDDKTEQPTGHRLEEAKDKGNVAKSRELNSVAVLIAGMIGFKATSGIFSRTIHQFFVTTYKESSFMQINVSTFPGQVLDFMHFLAILLLPIFVLIVLASLAANIGQVGFMLAKKALVPDFNKVNPFSGIKRLFSSRSLV